MTLNEANLSVRSKNCLRRAGITTMEQVAEMDSQELLALRGLGEGCLREIREALAIAGVAMKKRETPPNGSYLHGFREGASAMRAEVIRNLTAQTKQYRGAVRAGMLIALERVREMEEILK